MGCSVTPLQCERSLMDWSFMSTDNLVHSASFCWISKCFSRICYWASTVIHILLSFPISESCVIIIIVVYLSIFSYINICKLVNLLTSAFFSHSLQIVLLDLLLISIVAPFSPLVFKLQTDLSFIQLLFCGTNSHHSELRHVAYHVTPSPILNSSVSNLSTTLSWKLKTHLFTVLFLLSLYSPRLSQVWVILPTMHLSITYKTLQSCYLFHPYSMFRATTLSRSSDRVTLPRPTICNRLKL